MAQYPTPCRSTSGYCTFLGGNYISLNSKKQLIVARYSAEAEYKGMASTTTKLTWLSILFRDFGVPLTKAPSLHCDNMSALYISINHVLHAQMKYIELNYHCVWARVALDSLETRYVTSLDQLADIFTKPLLKGHFKLLRNKLGLCCLPQPCLRGSVKNENINPDPNDQESSLQDLIQQICGSTNT